MRETGEAGVGNKYEEDYTRNVVGGGSDVGIIIIIFIFFLSLH